MIYHEHTQWERRKPNLSNKTKILDFFNTEIEIIKENTKSTLHSNTVVCFQHTWYFAVQALAFGQIVLRVQLGGTTDIKTDLLGWGSLSASLTTCRAYLHLQMEIQPSSMDWPNQESFSLAVPQQHRLQFRLALAAPGTPGRSVQPTSIGCFADLVTVALGTWAQLNQGRAELELWSRTARPKCTESIQLALGSTDSASRKKSSLYKHFSGHGPFFTGQTAQQSYFAGSTPTEDSSDVKGTDELQAFFGTLARRDGNQLDPIWSIPASNVKARYLSKQLHGKPWQFRSVVKLGGPGHLCFA